MNRSNSFGDAVALMRRAHDYVLLSEMFNKTSIMLPTAIVEEYHEVVSLYGNSLCKEVSDALICMSVIMFGSLFLSDTQQATLHDSDFSPERRKKVSYFRAKRNDYIAHRQRSPSIEIPLDRLTTPDWKFSNGRIILSSLPAQCMSEEDRVEFLDLLEHTMDLLRYQWDKAYEAERINPRS